MPAEPPAAPGRARHRAASAVGGALAVGGAYLALRLALPDGPWWLGLLHLAAPALLLLAPLGALAAAALARRAALALAAVALLGAGFATLAPVLPLLRLTPPAPDGGGPRLRIATANVLGRAAGLEALAALEPDVLLLQEVPADLAEHPVALAFPYREIDGAWGNAVLSRIPVAAVAEPWARERGWAQRVELELEGGGSLTLWNAHAPWPIGPPRLPLPGPLGLAAGFDPDGRDAWLERLLAEVARGDGPVVVAGDFNLAPSEPPYAAFARAGLRDVHRERGRPFGATWPAAWPGVPPLLRIDRVHVGGGAIPVSSRVGPRTGSDHLPVVAEIELPSP